MAGTGYNGSLLNMLGHPHGIFVDIDFDLYVADTDNDRIQLFKPGELNATTGVGNGAPETISLSYPSGITLDADKHLFVVDLARHRIVGSTGNGFRCLVGCIDGRGQEPYQMWAPNTLSFDSYGNMFVIEGGNKRIQKFLFSMDSCRKSFQIF